MSFRPDPLPVLRILILGLVPALAACGNSDHPFSPLISDAGIEGSGVRMDAEVLVLEAGSRGWSGELDFSITNVTDRTISISNCHGDFEFHLERWSGSEWEYAWEPVRRLCQSFAITFQPGETRHFEKRVFAGYPGGNTGPRFKVEPIDGAYRLVVTRGYWDYNRDERPFGELVPRRHLTSGLFRIRTEGP